VDHMRTLNDILLKMGGLRLDGALGNFTDSRVVDFLSEFGRQFSVEGLRWGDIRERLQLSHGGSFLSADLWKYSAGVGILEG
jgi:hypothetical protein